MDEKNLRQIFEEIDPLGEIPQSKIEEAISAIINIKTYPMSGGGQGMPIKPLFHSLKEQLSEETDWRKRASIAARIISLELE